MDLRQLRYFVAIVEHGSLTAAAKALHIAQPALSHHLRNLEESFGVSLLRREARGVQPTRAGEFLFNHAVGLLRQAENLQSAMTRGPAVPGGAVAVGLPKTVARFLSLPIFEHARAAYPQLSLELIDGHSKDLGHAVAQGRLDFAVIMPPGPAHGSVEIALLTEELVVACPVRAAWLPATATLSLDQLSRLPMLMSNRRERLYELLSLLTVERKIELNICGHIDELASLVAAVAAGHGATVLPWCALQDSVERGLVTVRRIRGLPLSRQLLLCRSQSVPLSAAATAVAEVVRDVCRRLLSDGKWRGAKLAELQWERFVPFDPSRYRRPARHGGD